MIEEFVPAWSLAPIVRALQTLRGVDLVVAVTFATEIGDVRRFEDRASSWAILALFLVSVDRRDSQTRRHHQCRERPRSSYAGRERRTYRHAPRVGAKKLYRLEQAPPWVREIAWKPD